MKTMQLAIFNPRRSDNEKAYAFVFSDAHAQRLGIANGYYSHRLEDISRYENTAGGRDFLNRTPRIGHSKQEIFDTIASIEAEKAKA